MFKNASYRLGSVMLIIAFIFLVGCGGSESGLDGDASIAVEMTAHDSGDAGSNPTLTIDMIQGTCGTEDPPPADNPPSSENPAPAETTGPNQIYTDKITPEPFFDAFGQATFTYTFYCPTCPPGADETYIINSYTVEYIPRKSPDGHGGFFLPPKLVNLDQHILSQIVLTKDFKTAERTIILVPINTKAEYVNKTIAAGTPIQSIYSIRANFYGKNRAGNPFTLTSTLDVFFGNYDKCEAAG